MEEVAIKVGILRVKFFSEAALLLVLQVYSKIKIAEGKRPTFMFCRYRWMQRTQRYT